MRWSNATKKLTFYSTFKRDVTTSNSLELITNQNHRRAVAKLWAGNHNLRIESGRHSTPKLPEHLRICQYCSSNEVENETHFILFCNKYETIRNSLVEDIISKYPEFGYLTANNKIVFRFNSTDAFICERLGHFIYESFSLRNESFFRYKNCKLTAFATLILYFFSSSFFVFCFCVQ